MKAEQVLKFAELEDKLSDMLTRQAFAVLKAEASSDPDEVKRLTRAACDTGLLLARISWVLRSCVTNPKLPKLPDAREDKLIEEAERRAAEAVEAARQSVKIRVVNGSRY